MRFGRLFRWHCVGAACLAPTLALADAAVESTLLSDGTELLYGRSSDERTSAFRYVVRSGSSSDPAELSGTAHLLEHLIFHGGFLVSEDDIFHEARQAGAEIDAYTDSYATRYVLDAPTGEFVPLMEKMVEVISGPLLRSARIDLEKGVVANEALLRAQGLGWLLDALLFPGAQRVESIIGTAASRARIRAADLESFHRRHYVPSNTTIVVVSSLPLEEMRRVLDASSRLAPTTGAAPKPTDYQINVPSTNRAQAPVSLVLIGFVLEPADAAWCQGLALLASVRLGKEKALRHETAASCTDLRGHTVLFIAATSQRLDGASTALVDDVVNGLSTVALTAQEERDIASRSEHIRRRLANDSALLADELTELARKPPDHRGAELATLLHPARLDRDALLRAASRSLKPDSRFSFEVSPF